MKYIPLKQVVSLFLDEAGKSNREFDRCWLLGMRALIDLNFDISAEPKSVRIPVNGNKTVTLPADYISWTKIGVMNSNGELASIKTNNALSIFRDNNPNRIAALAPDVNSGFNQLVTAPVFINFYNNGMYESLWGIGGGLIQFGECRVDERNNVIVLDPHYPYPDVLLEYISNPQMDDDYQIELALQEAVIAFIGWKMKLWPEQRYYGEVIKARRRLPGKKVTLQTINQILREGQGFYVRS